MATDNLETLTLEFDNARAVQALYGGDDKLLRELEAALDVRVTSRDGWLRIEGGEDGGRGAQTRRRHTKAGV